MFVACCMHQRCFFVTTAHMGTDNQSHCGKSTPLKYLKPPRCFRIQGTLAQRNIFCAPIPALQTNACLLKDRGLIKSFAPQQVPSSLSDRCMYHPIWRSSIDERQCHRHKSVLKRGDLCRSCGASTLGQSGFRKHRRTEISLPLVWVVSCLSQIGFDQVPHYSTTPKRTSRSSRNSHDENGSEAWFGSELASETRWDQHRAWVSQLSQCFVIT